MTEASLEALGFRELKKYDQGEFNRIRGIKIISRSTHFRIGESHAIANYFEYHNEVYSIVQSGEEIMSPECVLVFINADKPKVQRAIYSFDKNKLKIEEEH